MLTFDRKQMANLRGPATRSFEARIAELLARHFQEAIERMNPESLRTAIRQGIALAEAEGMTGEKQVARYLLLSFVLGLQADRDERHVTAFRLLHDVGVAPGQRLQSAFDALMPRPPDHATPSGAVQRDRL